MLQQIECCRYEISWRNTLLAAAQCYLYELKENRQKLASVFQNQSEYDIDELKMELDRLRGENHALRNYEGSVFI